MSFGCRIPAKVFLSGGLLGLVVGCGKQAPDPTLPEAQIDHVILAVSDLLTGMVQLQEMTGVQPVWGGDHPGRGTRNALISLGPRQYLELLAPQEGVELPEEVAGLLELENLTAWGWAASTDALAATLEGLRSQGFQTLEGEPGSRATPVGDTLRWIAGGVIEPEILGAPFFIQWDTASPHPATTSPRGCELVSLSVATPDSETLSRFVQAVGLEVQVEAGSELIDRYQIVLQCPAGTVVFR